MIYVKHPPNSEKLAVVHDFLECKDGIALPTLTGQGKESKSLAVAAFLSSTMLGSLASYYINVCNMVIHLVLVNLGIFYFGCINF